MNQTMKQTFITPPNEFSPLPFWFWNDKLDEATITKQIEDFYEKGVCGFVIHPRIGVPLDIPYLSDCYMHYVKYAVEEARKREMLVVLYDEAMYPSGSAHGMVIQGHPEYATRALRMEECPPDADCPPLEEGETLLSAQTVRFPDAATGEALERRLFFIECYSKGTIRGIHEGEDDRQPHAPASADLLNPEAMKRFIHLTHDRYYEVLREYFGSTVIAFFTDEPDVLGRNHRRGVVPWTKGFMDWWRSFGGDEKFLPLLWLDRTADFDKEKSESVRHQFNKAVNKLLGQSYYAQLSDWCASHGIALTGHPAKSYDIGFLSYFQIPGQDLVYRWVAPEGDSALIGPDATMAKCSSDAARHSGKRRNANECFGCCGFKENQWLFSADDMKWFLDWLFVRGVNMLYPHAFFYSIDGKLRYGERPPDVGPNNIWWQDYRLFSDYMKRMCWLMTDGFNTTPIAILCEESNLPWKMAAELFRSQIEFNYLEDGLILGGPGKAAAPLSCVNGELHIVRQAYRLLLVESASFLTPELLQILKPFLDQGGHLLLLEEKEGENIPETKNLIRISALSDLVPTIERLGTQENVTFREVKLAPARDGIRVSHIVKGGQSLFLLVNEAETPYIGQAAIPMALLAQDDLTSRLLVEKWDPWKGTCAPTPYAIQDGHCLVPIQLERRESMILAFDPASADAEPPVSPERFRFPAWTAVELKDLKWHISDARIFPAVIEAGLAKATPEIAGAALSDWTTWPGMEHFSGSVQYETTLSLEKLPAGPIYLDLGEVHELARLTVNGHFAGVRMWAPYGFDVTDYLTAGDNLLHLEIVNSLANAMMQHSRPSGLLGPIRLRLQTE